MWDERFTFEIQTGSEDLQVIVAYKDDYNALETIGKVDISLEFLKDQMKHDEWFDLENHNLDNLKQSAPLAGHIRLILQWIYCREKYF